MIMSYITESGILDIGKVPWGSHFCQLYSPRQNLPESLAPYFVAGLRNRERCIWLASNLYEAKNAEADLRRVLPELDGMIDEEQIQIRTCDEWHAGVLRSPHKQVVDQWVKEEQKALNEGNEGLRIAVNMTAVAPDWDVFMAYEKAAHNAFMARRIVALCSYSLAKCRATDIFEVVRTHHFTVRAKNRHWEMLAPTTRSSVT